jgi:hypothetical protein
MAGEDRFEVEVVDSGEGHYDDILAMRASLGKSDIPFQQLARIRKSAGPEGGTTYLPLLTVLAPYGVAVITALGGWLAGRSGRKVRIKIGDTEVEAGSVKELEQLLAVVKAHTSGS